MQMPLSRYSQQDELIWNGTQLGDFTVKSAYFYARQILGFAVEDLRNRRPLWRCLWQAEVIPKIKFFLWRVVWNLLPIAKNLQIRGVPCQSSCPVCGEENEDWRHIFFHCPLSLQFWSTDYAWVAEIGNDQRTGVEFWDFTIETAIQKGSLSTLLIGCWLLWKNHNRCLHDQLCSSPNHLQRTRDQLLSGNTAVSDPEDNPLLGDRNPNSQQAWLPPSDGIIKINVDFGVKGGEARVGVVARDCNGEVRWCCAEKTNNGVDPLQGECLAITCGLNLAIQNRVEQVLLESDCLQIVKVVNSGSPSFWEGGNLLAEIRTPMQQLPSCKVEHVYRTQNKCAHNLVKSVGIIEKKYIWYNSFPMGFCNPDSVSS